MYNYKRIGKRNVASMRVNVADRSRECGWAHPGDLALRYLPVLVLTTKNHLLDAHAPITVFQEISSYNLACR